MFLTKDSKSPYYQLIYIVNGKRTKISTKTSSKKEAEKFLHSFNPGSRGEVVINRRGSVRLGQFTEEYKIFTEATYSTKYLKNAVTPSFNKFQKFIADVPLENISSKDIDQFISSVYCKHKYAASLYYRTLKASFNKAVNWGYINENPFKKIKAPKLTKQLPVFISDTELLSIINNTSEQFLKDLFLSAFYTGMRAGELLNMRWNWIDFNQNIITVKCSESFTTKSKKERIIPMTSTLRSTLFNKFSQLMKISSANYVFTRYPGIKLNEDYVSKKFKKLVRKLELNDKIHFHSLRHSFASLLVQRGVSLYLVKELLGHEDLSTTQIYSHLQADNLVKAINRL